MSGRAVLVGVVAALSLLASNLTPAAAVETVEIVSPVAGGEVVGIVDVTVAVSGSPAVVRLRGDGQLLESVESPGASTVVPWDTRRSANGWHGLVAEACYSGPFSDCVTTAEVRVQVANPVPRITSPASGALISGLVRVTLDDSFDWASAGVHLDGNYLGSVPAGSSSIVFDAARFADGVHYLTAGWVARSEPLAVTIKSLHPSWSTTTQNGQAAFSPNGDGVLDVTQTRLSLPQRQAVALTVTDRRGAVIRGPISLGVLSAGIHALVWDGKDSSGAVAPDGFYGLTVRTKAGSLYGAASTGVTLDTAKPAAAGLVGNGATIYPADDNYKDHFRWAFRIRETSVVTFRAASATGKTVRTKSVALPVGARGISWDGRRADGTMVAPGTYAWRLSVTDGAGNTWRSPRYTVRVLAGRLVTRTVSAAIAGSRVAEVRGTAACARVEPSQLGSGRRRLVNACRIGEVGYQTVGAIYRLTLAPFVSYESILVKVNAAATSSTESFVWAVTPGADRWPTGPGIGTYAHRRLPASSDTWRSYRVGGFGSVSPLGTVEVGVGVATGLVPTHALDIKQVKVQITGQVFR